MKFACQRNSILKEIAQALDFTSQRNSLSILSYVLLETVDNRLTIKATDQKMGFTSSIEVETIEEGSLCLYCDKLLGILRNMPDDTIIFEEKGELVTVSSASRPIEFDLRSVGKEKFPPLQVDTNHTYFSLSQKDFFEMIEQTIFAISDDETRYFMNGLYLEQESTGLVMVGTDGKRLSYINRKFEDGIPSFAPVIIPGKFLNLLKKQGTEEGQLAIALDENIIFVKMGTQLIYSNLIKGQFPNYRRVIPASQPNIAKFSINDMNEALKRVSLLVENKAKRLFINIKEGEIVVSSEESEYGQAQEIIECEYEGESCEIALNYLYLTTPLRNMEGEMGSISFTDSNKAITLAPDPQKDYFHIVMPMQID
ncbi:MAG: DNA polymerase III subunit beta [Sphaerochaetaceae bacterium]|jgi:DNA polymerase-3 subunit beta